MHGYGVIVIIADYIIPPPVTFNNITSSAAAAAIAELPRILHTASISSNNHIQSLEYFNAKATF